MRIFKSKWFAKFAGKNRISDDALRAAVAEIEAGSFNADLGGHVYKQRVAREGQGKSGGYRTIVLFKQGERAFFMYGFAKNELDNITEKALLLYKRMAVSSCEMTDEEITASIDKGDLFEI